MTNRQWYTWQLIDMSDDEFADSVCSTCVDCKRLGINCNYSGSCHDKLLEWLKQEHKENSNEL